MALLLSPGSQVLIAIIRLYQYLISPLFGPHCRFRPTCSQYGIEALHRFGVVKGSWLTVKRILKCHPLHPSKDDPVHSRSYLIPEKTKMESQRNLFIIALLFLSFIIWQVYEQDKNPQELQQHYTNTQATITAMGSSDNNVLASSSSSSNGKKIIVKTDVLELTINTSGGDVEQALLLNYPKMLKTKEPFQLLETTPEFIYQAQSGLTDCEKLLDNSINGLYPLYNIDKDIFTLVDGQNELVIPMTWTDASDNTFTKTFSLKRGEYAVNVCDSVNNAGNKPLLVSNFGQLKQSIQLPSHRQNSNGDFALHTFRGAAYSTIDEKYGKYDFNTIADNENLNISAKGGWIAMLQQYFATAWIPPNNSINNFYTANIGNGVVAIGYKSQPILVQPGKTVQLQNTLWVGPEIQDKMAAVAPHLDLTVDYGWLWFISQPLFMLLKFIQSFLGNWGFSIIVITFIVRGVMYPLTKAQYTATAKIRMLQPKIQAMRKRLGDNKHLQNQEMIALYKSEKVNPLGGCLPLLIQMPIFLALYYMLVGSVELRHAPLALWIYDLSAKDPYYILPILMGITMFLIQKISPTTTEIDPMQKKIMIFMPIIFTVFFFWFPSGLVLYYIVSNLVTIIQQQLIYRDLEKRGLYDRGGKSAD